MGWINTAPDLPLVGDRNGLVFKETNYSYVESSPIANFGTGDFGICFDFTCSTRGTTVSTFDAFISFGDYQSANNYLNIDVNSYDGKIDCWFNSANKLKGITVIDDGKRRTLFLTRSQGVLYLYLNGVLESSVANTDNLQCNWLKFGFSKVDSYLNGTMSNISIWNRGFTATDITNYSGKTLNGDETGLQLYYKCQEGYGDILHDSTANNNVGTINGAKWVVPKNTNSVYELQFNGSTSSYVEIPDSNSLHAPYNCTWLFDVTPYDFTNKWCIVSNTTNISQQVEYVCMGIGGGKIGYCCLSGAWVFTTNAVLSINTLNKVAVVVTTNTVTFYLNGKLIETKVISYSSASLNSVWRIGSSYGDPNSPLYARLKNLKLYNRALTDSEIKAISNDMPHPTNGLVLDLPMDEGYGYGVVKDRSTYGNDGSINGASWVLGDRQGLSFTANTNKVATPYKHNYSSGVTIRGKFKTTSTIQSTLYDDADNTGSNSGIAVLITTNKIRVMCGKSGAQNFNITGTSSVNDGKIHDYAITWDGTTSTNGVKIYIDGVLEVQGTAISQIALATYTSTIGNCAVYQEAIIGNIYETQIWNRALSAAEIAMYKDMELTGNEPSLVFYWKGKTSSDGKYAIDESEFANHGLITGCTPVSESAQIAKVAAKRGLIL